jgi:lipopolysaccharide transport system ATP-binding protein
MNDVAIRTENLSKVYSIGKLRSYQRTFKELATEEAKKAVCKALTLFQKPRDTSAQLDESLWALKEVSFDVNRGEIIGIIGRNGAGKTTLLKILSRITEPTDGYAEIHGRIGALLDVGTGFHPELTGRENIFLAGAILGMRKAEMSQKFDEIVAFSEIEKFIDTPVKRYSAGMFFRIAFSVAAHLEPEILVIDEVLSVSDLPFQIRCIERIREFADSGRTVLFVSHDIHAILSLCSRCILLERGRLKVIGETEDVVQQYRSKVKIEVAQNC